MQEAIKAQAEHLCRKINMMQPEDRLAAAIFLSGWEAGQAAERDRARNSERASVAQAQ